MIKDNQTRFNRLHVLLDALVIAAAYILSWFIFLKIGMFGKAGILPTWFYMSALVIIVPVYLLLYTFFKTVIKHSINFTILTTLKMNQP